MAEEETGQEKTEEATPKREEKAREDGQVARSRELGTTLLLVTGGAAILVFGASLNQRLQGVMRFNFDFERAAAMDSALMLSHLGHSIGSMIDLVAIILLMLLVAGVIGSIGLGGWIFSTKSLMPKGSRMNPLEGLKRMFSMKSLVELFKALAKFLVVATVAVVILLQMKDDLLLLGLESLPAATRHAAWIIAWSALGMAAATIIVALVDVPFQIFDHTRKLRMTRQQVKDEFKDAEGKPEVKSRVRQLQREMAMARMMEAVPEADVVITNPEHFSVAIKYDMDASGAPKVVAKGADQVAMKIREIAKHCEVPLVQSPLLTRAVYFTTDLEEEIPAGLYMAVAQLLAYIYQLRARPVSASRSFNFDQRVEVPPDLRFDAEGESLD